MNFAIQNNLLEKLWKLELKKNDSLVEIWTQNHFKKIESISLEIYWNNLFSQAKTSNSLRDDLKFLGKFLQERFWVSYPDREYFINFRRNISRKKSSLQHVDFFLRSFKNFSSILNCRHFH